MQTHFKSLLAAVVALVALGASAAWAQKGNGQAMNISQTVVKMRIADNVSLDDAVESMKLRGNALNIKLVAELPLSKQVEAMTGKPVRRVEIYQFCDALTAKQMVDFSIDFAAYLPCRIALVEDDKQPGRGWLVMMDLNMLINAAKLTPEMKAKAIEVRDTLESIMKAGANGDL
ncbi:uncharacterized protein (DUF302 family) [Sulfuritortus calidifontis]|uniref:Uncharacterized protein (DUF302 family) n=1 Tax=Sulfuritortus calidifontis TaxID=1914471 RepID=A0A4R3JYT7_9PROT|nr:DUF302 domain-containing protein [Sulfuritortus calidifontis]TCS72453.1 uncharacterized protein (DUF302 family) [Sulfuritortus calidifontis]